MRKANWLVGLAALAALLWGGYWYLGTLGLRAALDDIQRPADGTASGSVSAESYTISGFPNRFDITLNQPVLQDGPVTWSSPFLQIFALTYRPHHIIAVSANEQVLHLGGTTLHLSTEDMRASLVMQPTRRLLLDRFSLVAQRPVLRFEGGHHADAARAALRLIDPASNRYEGVVEIETLFPDQALMDVLDPDRLLPRRFDVLRLDAEITTDAALDLDRVIAPPARADGTLTLTGARVAFDGVDLQARGRVRLDAPQGPEGEITLVITGWAAFSDRLGASGLVEPQMMTLIDRSARSVMSAEDPDRLEMPLRVTGGMVRMGPVELFSLPGF